MYILTLPVTPTCYPYLFPLPVTPPVFYPASRQHMNKLLNSLTSLVIIFSYGINYYIFNVINYNWIVKDVVHKNTCN